MPILKNGRKDMPISGNGSPENDLRSGKQGGFQMREIAVCFVLVLGITGSGCAHMNHAESGALTGGALGTVAGAMIGSDSGHAGGGALIGAAAGAIAGGLVGEAEDAREERDAAIARANYERANSRAQAEALSMADVVTMTHAGVADDVIVNAVQTRGVRFDGSPDAIIQLKQQGVSDRVVSAMQRSGVRTPVPVAGRYPPPRVVYVEPQVVPPPMVVHYGHHHHHRHWDHPRRRNSFHVGYHW
jgi:uncharacterized protein YcfJ